MLIFFVLSCTYLFVGCGSKKKPLIVDIIPLTDGHAFQEISEPPPGTYNLVFAKRALNSLQYKYPKAKNTRYDIPFAGGPCPYAIFPSGKFIVVGNFNTYFISEYGDVTSTTANPNTPMLYPYKYDVAASASQAVMVKLNTTIVYIIYNLDGSEKSTMTITPPVDVIYSEARVAVSSAWIVITWVATPTTGDESIMYNVYDATDGVLHKMDTLATRSVIDTSLNDWRYNVTGDPLNPVPPPLPFKSSLKVVITSDNQIIIAWVHTTSATEATIKYAYIDPDSTDDIHELKKDSNNGISSKLNMAVSKDGKAVIAWTRRFNNNRYICYAEIGGTMSDMVDFLTGPDWAREYMGNEFGYRFTSFTSPQCAYNTNGYIICWYNSINKKLHYFNNNNLQIIDTERSIYEYNQQFLTLSVVNDVSTITINLVVPNKDVVPALLCFLTIFGTRVTKYDFSWNDGDGANPSPPGN
jgi:hypothetical protein